MAGISTLIDRDLTGQIAARTDAGRLVKLLKIPYDMSSLFYKYFADIRQLNTLMRTDHQNDAQLIFQLIDGLADGLLSDIEIFCGDGDRISACYHADILQLFDIHRPTPKRNFYLCLLYHNPFFSTRWIYRIKNAWTGKPPYSMRCTGVCYWKCVFSLLKPGK